MIFGNKTLYTTNEILDSLLSTGDIKDATGAVVITKKDGRKTVATGKIFFRNELIYAVEVSNREVPIGKRVESGGLVDSDDLDGIFRRLGSKTSPRIVDQLLVAQLISEKNLNVYVKEHFIETLSYILSWDNSVGEWHPNVTTTDFVMPYVALDKIRAILNNRANLRKEFSIAVRSFFKDNEIDKLTFVSTIRDHSDYPAEIRAILRRATGEYTVADIAGDTGISNFAVFQSVISLWKKNLLILRLGGIDLPFASLQEAVKPAPEEAAPVVEESFVPLASEEEDVTKKELDPVEEIAKADDAVAQEFVNSTAEYVDELDETQEESTEEVTEEDTLEEDAVSDSPAVEEQNEVSEDVTDVDVSYEEFPEEIAPEEDEAVEYPVIVDVNDPSDFITVEDIEDDVEIEKDVQDDEIFLTDETVTDEDSVPLHVDEEESSEVELHFENLPAPIHIEHEEALVEPELEHEPVIETKKEETLTPPVNASEANQTIAAFTAQLNALQAELSSVADVISGAKETLDSHEDAVSDAEQKLAEAQKNVAAAKANYEEAKFEVEAAEERYSSIVADIETLVQSFKFSA